MKQNIIFHVGLLSQLSSHAYLQPVLKLGGPNCVRPSSRSSQICANLRPRLRLRGICGGCLEIESQATCLRLRDRTNLQADFDVLRSSLSHVARPGVNEDPATMSATQTFEAALKDSEPRQLT